MERKLLYYPYIDIPNRTFIRKSILYLDKLSSIVPYDYNYRMHFNEEVAILEEEGIYEPLSTEILYLDYELKRNFEERVKKYFSSQSLKYKPKEFSIIHKNKIPQVRIHQNKMIHKGSEIYEFFKEFGIILGEDEEWIYMDTKSASSYMSILAVYLAQMDNDYTIPATDNEKFEITAFNLKKIDLKNSNIENYSLALNLLLKDLPAPSPDVSIEKILKFKRERKFELLEFRSFLENHFEKLKKSENELELKRNAQLFKEELDKEILKLELLLKDYNMGFIKFTFKTLIDVLFDGIKLNLGNAIDRLYHLVFYKKGLIRKAQTSQLAYLYLGKRESILKY